MYLPDHTPKQVRLEGRLFAQGGAGETHAVKFYHGVGKTQIAEWIQKPRRVRHDNDAGSVQRGGDENTQPNIVDALGSFPEILSEFLFQRLMKAYERRASDHRGHSSSRTFDTNKSKMWRVR